ncbi:hypothetical protein B1H18_22540 [Streptomyces tsukubensis]|uniref:Uncharacterized protein n=1 Tax=Streptomyces tsukubensis TaxID=83656 RepID=A0A1V4A5J4_9ACTN|nr:hypothetical protein B1H18_22540 [Streptomyces tsukubensis]
MAFWYELLGALGGPAQKVAELGPELVRDAPAGLGDGATRRELAKVLSVHLSGVCGQVVEVAAQEPGRHSWEPALLQVCIRVEAAAKLAAHLRPGARVAAIPDRVGAACTR